jgi:hypothetical protein
MVDRDVDRLQEFSVTEKEENQNQPCPKTSFQTRDPGVKPHRPVAEPERETSFPLSI